MYSVCLFVTMADVIVIKSGVNKLSMLIQHMHCVDFFENALFRSSGDICRPPSSSSLLDQLAMDK